MASRDDYALLEDEGTGYLVSVSDMMSGLLFVFMITLTVFIINFQDAADKTVVEKVKLEETLDDLTNQQRLRAQMLERIRAELEARGIKVQVDEEHGVLRLTENAIFFPSGRATLPPEERVKLQLIGDVLMQILPCYTAHPAEENSCSPETVGKLEAVFIEGHTDNVPIRNDRFADNWELSAERAVYTYRYLIDEQPQLDTLVSAGQQKLFSVSGYGEGRPVRGHETRTADPANRRIDLRFIMTPPKAEPRVIDDLKKAGVR